MQAQLKDYKNWRIIANRHPGYTIFMGYKVKDNKAVDDLNADTLEELKLRIDESEKSK